MIDSTSFMCYVRDIISIINNFLPIILGTLYLNIYLNSVQFIKLHIYNCIQKFQNCKPKRYFRCMNVTKIYFN